MNNTSSKNGTETTSKAGARIRAYRERHDWSVYDLSQKSGVAEKTINAIEKGEVMPALGVLVKIAQALGQRLGTFMDDQFKPDPVITRAADIEAKKVAGEGMNEFGYASHSLALGKPDRHMDPFRIEFTANAPTSPSSHEGEELIIVLAGSVELTYGVETTVLHAGDTAYYNSVVTHSLRALDGKPASIYGIVFLPF